MINVVLLRIREISKQKISLSIKAVVHSTSIIKVAFSFEAMF